MVWCALSSLSDDLVSVVVPAFNAASTICETICSVLNQSHRNIEVIIVDDGSTDQTKTVVASLMQHDPRVRYTYKQNGGVASARNQGIAESRGEFIATLDADDLWHPTKLERQLRRFHENGSETALVYAWCCWIDHSGTITGFAPPTRHEGRILAEMCLGNVIISGSNALIRRDALIAAGGFDETLRARGGQGCEDWKLYLNLSEHHSIAMVPEYLVGYRFSPGSMSDDFDQMMRSRKMVEEEFISSHAELAGPLARGELILARSLALRAIERGQFREAVELLTNRPQGRLVGGIAALIWLLAGSTRRIFRRTNLVWSPTPTRFPSVPADSSRIQMCIGRHITS